MIKKMLFVCMALVSFSMANAQSKQFQISDRVASVGVGLGSGYAGSGYGMVVPPISISYEQGFKQNLFSDKDVITIGGYAGFASYNWEYGYGFDGGYRYTHIVIGARSAVHYPFIEKLDTYAGIMLGYHHTISSSYGTYSSSSYTYKNYSPLAFSGYLGARYYFKDNLAVLGEIGYGISYLTIGISKKL